ncbi:MAG: methyltransferase [Cyclobacteriaceae bacterium]|nr:methyltransferase [Cyclobacteriaceae bacterium]
MKVGTDAVLIGAWANVDNAKSILDIGTGSGVIALMMAQRSASDTRIDAVELQKEDAEQASENVSSSPWSEKVKVFHRDILEFRPDKKYDLIVCNPPFFTKSLLPPDTSRRDVRHDDQLNFNQLIESVIRMISPNGNFNVILPTKEAEILNQKASQNRLHLNKLTDFFSRNDKPQERSLMEFGMSLRQQKTDSLTLYKSGMVWSEEYRALTSEFYLQS